jgi:hypothetical protein
MMELNSWYQELRNFESLDYRPISDEKCDIIFKRPSFIIKLDAGIIFSFF